MRFMAFGTAIGLSLIHIFSGDYGGQCMKDYFTAIDEMAKESFVDKDRLGCVGASFGGFDFNKSHPNY